MSQKSVCVVGRSSLATHGVFVRRLYPLRSIRFLATTKLPRTSFFSAEQLRNSIYTNDDLAHCLSLQWIVDFDNYVSIVTKGDASTILFDGNAIPVDQWSYTSYGYAYTSFAITAGAHCITVKSGSSTLFAAYCYGHSPLSWSTSAYGYTATFAGMRRETLLNQQVR